MKIGIAIGMRFVLSALLHRILHREPEGRDFCWLAEWLSLIILTHSIIRPLRFAWVNIGFVHIVVVIVWIFLLLLFSACLFVSVVVVRLVFQKWHLNSLLGCIQVLRNQAYMYIWLVCKAQGNPLNHIYDYKTHWLNYHFPYDLMSARTHSPHIEFHMRKERWPVTAKRIQSH